MNSYIGLIPLFPLIGFLINGVWYAFGQAPVGHKKAHAPIPGVIATIAIFASFVVSLMLFMNLHGMAGEDRVMEQSLYHWVTIGSFNLDIAFRLDSLNTLFTLVITGIGTLIHLYSIGYMGHDESPGKFFCYLNLFCFAMLMLVLGSSLPILFMGWEGVGLCSYLLIGFWYTDEEKAKAGKKAFIVNRVGDFGFLLGMFLIYWTFGTLDFAQLAHTIGHAGIPAGIDPSIITTICVLLFIGCMGKSAQIPLYIWLPDAMAGPTPVSALIHAATMVTSGIYMVSRLNFMYSLAPDALRLVAVIGAVTAFFAATIAIVQTDIKKILAYSTVSQLGYMFLGCGVGAYSAGVFHVITHAFFKALMFLGAGSVIHGMHEEQDIMKMGGLKKYMKWTYFTFMAGWLAICGIPPFAGFFSKDEILWQSFSSPNGSIFLWALGVLTAIMTAFYMTRLFALTFWGKPRFDENAVTEHAAGHAQSDPKSQEPTAGSTAHGDHSHGGHTFKPGHSEEHHAPAGVHESPWTMVLPLVILAIASTVGGALLGWPHASWIERWLEPVIPVHEAIIPMAQGLEIPLMIVSVIGALFGLFLATGLYKDLSKPKELARKFATLHRVLWNKWYVDEIYEAAIVRPIHMLSEALWKGFDVQVIDRVVLGVGRVTEWSGQTVRVLQNGSIQIYALMLLLGVIATVGYLIYGLA